MITKKTILKLTDSIIGSFLCMLMGRAPSARHRSDGKIDITPDNVKRILVIRPGGIGDMIILLPLIRNLSTRFKSAAIDIVCEKRNMDVLQIAGIAQMAMVYDRKPLSFLRALRRNEYDLAIDSEQFHNFSSIFSFLSAAPVRIGFKINPLRNPLYTHLVSYDPDGPEGEQFSKLLAPISGPPPQHTLIGTLADNINELPHTFSEQINNIPGSDQFALIQPGTSDNYKKWPAGNYAALASKLVSELKMKVVFSGSSHEKPLCDSIINICDSSAKESIISFAGKLTLKETASLAAAAEIYIGPDSGVAHLAVAAGTPTVILFGPSDAKKWGTIDSNHAVIRENLPCSPCFIFGYSKPCSSFECMKQIKPDSVFAAAQKILKEQD